MQKKKFRLNNDPNSTAGLFAAELMVKEVGESYENYEPTRAGRAISEFVTENLSNWFVRLSRKRYWGGEYSTDKISAYQTLYTLSGNGGQTDGAHCPVLCRFALFRFKQPTGKEADQSVHLADFPRYDEKLIDKELEEKMGIAQKLLP
jgi:isoleucyl-tRNA synthetase